MMRDILIPFWFASSETVPVTEVSSVSVSELGVI